MFAEGGADRALARSSDGCRTFGDYVPDLLKAIENNRRRFQADVLGPIGSSARLIVRVLWTAAEVFRVGGHHFFPPFRSAAQGATSP